LELRQKEATVGFLWTIDNDWQKSNLTSIIVNFESEIRIAAIALRFCYAQPKGPS
jgi:hypothetical protein